MAEPENHALHLLRDIRGAIEALSRKVDLHHEQTSGRFEQVNDRLDRLRQAMAGESVLGRYAAGEVDERPDALEKRVTALEERR